MYFLQFCVRCIKFLGVIIDERLNWANQTNSLICKLSKTGGTLRSLSSCLPKSLRAPVFSALVNSHITYGITVWGGNSTNLEKVLRAQKKCVRSLYKIKRRRKFKGSYIYGHTKQIFSTNSFLTAHNLYNFSMISDAFKVITSKSPTSYYKNCYQVSSVNPGRLLSSKCSLSSLETNFHHMIPILWNSFYSVNKISKFSLCGFKPFKRSLKAFLISMQTSFEANVWHKFNNDLVDYCNYLEAKAPMPEPSLQPASCQSLIYILHSLSPSFLPSSCLSFSTHTFSNPLLLLRILSFECYSNTHIFQPFSDLAISVLSYFLSVLLFSVLWRHKLSGKPLLLLFSPLSWLAWHVPHHSTFHLFIDFLIFKPVYN